MKNAKDKLIIFRVNVIKNLKIALNYNLFFLLLQFVYLRRIIYAQIKFPSSKIYYNKEVKFVPVSKLRINTKLLTG